MADPATILASNIVWVPYFLSRAACLVSFCKNKYFFFWWFVSFLHQLTLKEKSQNPGTMMTAANIMKYNAVRLYILVFTEWNSCTSKYQGGCISCSRSTIPTNGTSQYRQMCSLSPCVDVLISSASTAPTPNFILPFHGPSVVPRPQLENRAALWGMLLGARAGGRHGGEREREQQEKGRRRRRGERLQLSCMGCCRCCCCCCCCWLVVLLHRLHRSSIPPSERMEKTRSGYVIPPQAGGEAHGRERDSGEEEVEGGRFPAQYSLFSHFSMDTMYGIWSCFFGGADTQMDAAVSSIFCAHASSMNSVFSFFPFVAGHTVHSAVVSFFFFVFFFSFFFFFFLHHFSPSWYLETSVHIFWSGPKKNKIKQDL